MESCVPNSMYRSHVVVSYLVLTGHECASRRERGVSRAVEDRDCVRRPLQWFSNDSGFRRRCRHSGRQRRGLLRVASERQVDAYGATNYGSLSSNSLPVGSTATGIALDPTTGGYWVLSSNGAVAGFNAPSYGQTLVPSGGWGQHPAAVAIAAGPTGMGYYVLRANGAVYGYGVKRHRVPSLVVCTTAQPRRCSR